MSDSLDALQCHPTSSSSSAGAEDRQEGAGHRGREGGREGEVRRGKDREGRGGGRSKENGDKEKWSRNKLLHAFSVALIFYKDNVVKTPNYKKI